MAVNKTQTNSRSTTGTTGIVTEQTITSRSDPSTEHPDYTAIKADWTRVRDCISGESKIKSKKTAYLPQPAGMTGVYASAYDAYIERAHFPLVTSYSLQGALGVVITKLPEFNLPKQLEYLLETATKEGDSLAQLFMDIVVDVFTTGRCPLVVDVVQDTNQFKFVKYQAEDLVNWKQEAIGSEKNLILGVIKEKLPENDDILAHTTEDVYRVMYIQDGKFTSRAFKDAGTEIEDLLTSPSYMGKSIDFIPLFVAGSINTNIDIQPIPLLATANCAIQIYRKEADLSNSEFLTCNPTLIMTGVTDDDDIPNVVGSSVLINLPDPQSRAFYTQTDTVALQHVKEHIKDLYEEAIRHGVAILDARKGVEAAEALRIRQATQSASIYSIYLSALNVIHEGLVAMCTWGGFDASEISIDAPTSLTTGIPDSAVIKEIIEGFGKNVIPLSVIHRYLIASDLIDNKISFDDYMNQLTEQRAIITPQKDDASQKDVTTQPLATSDTTQASEDTKEKEGEYAL